MSILTTSNQEYDVYRDSYLRILGYSREIGDLCGHFFSSRISNLSQSLKLAYILSDTADKALKVHKSPGSTMRDVAIGAGDAATWQVVASIILPGVTINKITSFSRFALRHLKVPCATCVASTIGLISIPLIVKPIDRLTDSMMEETYRRYIK